MKLAQDRNGEMNMALIGFTLTGLIGFLVMMGCMLAMTKFIMWHYERKMRGR